MYLNSYPQSIEVDGIQYKLNTDFRVALRCFEIIDDENIDEYERTLAITYLLLGDIPFDKLDKILPLLKKYLCCGEERDEEEIESKRDMDLLHDEKYIIASFMSDYNIDLSQIEHIHWYQFITLLSGLTNDCILNRVREIRTMDLKDYKGKARAKLQRAKEQLALPPRHHRLSQEEEEAMARFEEKLKGNSDNSSLEPQNNAVEPQI